MREQGRLTIQSWKKRNGGTGCYCTSCGEWQFFKPYAILTVGTKIRCPDCGRVDAIVEVGEGWYSHMPAEDGAEFLDRQLKPLPSRLRSTSKKVVDKILDFLFVMG